MTNAHATIASFIVHDRQGLWSLTASLEHGRTSLEPGAAPVETEAATVEPGASHMEPGAAPVDKGSRGLVVLQWPLWGSEPSS